MRACKQLHTYARPSLSPRPPHSSDTLHSPHPLQHFDRSWLSHVMVKSMLYDAEAQMQVGSPLTYPLLSVL